IMGLGSTVKAIWVLLQGQTDPNVTSIWTLLQNMSITPCCIGKMGGVAYYVDDLDGLDANDGLSWANAVQTIGRAIALNNETVDWAETPKKYNAIYVKPAVYTEEDLSFPYYCWLIGLGIRGVDTQAEIHPAAGSCFAGTMLGCSLVNLWLEVDEALPILDIGSAGGSLIDHCQFYFNADIAVTGIDTETATHLEVRFCDFGDGSDKFFYRCIANHGGAGMFAHNCRYHDNNMYAYECGIWIEGTCRGTQTVIKQNVIQVNTAPDA
ncbi:unnamed protein product, partial [marine sediment metagenome]